MDPESPELIQSTLKRVGFTLYEYDSDDGVMCLARRGQHRVEVTAPTSDDAWRALWSLL